MTKPDDIDQDAWEKMSLAGLNVLKLTPPQSAIAPNPPVHG